MSYILDTIHSMYPTALKNDIKKILDRKWYEKPFGIFILGFISGFSANYLFNLLFNH